MSVVIIDNVFRDFSPFNWLGDILSTIIVGNINCYNVSNIFGIDCKYLYLLHLGSSDSVQLDAGLLIWSLSTSLQAEKHLASSIFVLNNFLTMLIEETIWMKKRKIKIAKVFMVRCYFIDCWLENNAD